VHLRKEYYNMPKINRIRITNFSFNNNQRHIIDEVFDFYNGENALLSLANGGGKSVLVQTILQPIVPKTKLLGRSFSDFFIGKKDPAYIMIEWLLDDEAGYLLTGIGISPSNNYNPNLDEDNLNLRFFTFCHQYDEGNKFDIKLIPVTEAKNNGIVITGYNEVKKLLLNGSNKGKYEISCYDSSKDEQKAYERKLITYNISRNEWKELMVNINQAEHGVSEVFSQCKSSRQVMEQWIIKYIEKVLDKSYEDKVSDHQKLEEMMVQVATAEVENENFILEYEAIENFRIDLKLMENNAKDICALIDIESEKKKVLASAYHFFSNKLTEILDTEIQVKNDISQSKIEIEQIDLEKKSYEIYKFEEKINILEDKLENVKEKIEDVTFKINKTQFELNLQQGAREYEVIEEKSIERAELEQSLENAAKDQEALIKEINRIEYSLKCFYLHEIDSIDLEIKKNEDELKKIVVQKKDISIMTKFKNDQKSKLNASMGELKEKTDVFRRYEESTFKELGIQLTRNPLLNELNQEELDMTSEKLRCRLSDLKTVEVKIKEDIVKSNEQVTIEKDNLSKWNTALMDTKEKYSENEHTINKYEEKKEIIKSIISTYFNSYYSVFDQEAILNQLRKQYYQWNQKAISCEMEINELSKLINGLNEGISYLPAMLVNILKDNDLEIFTGEQYLRDLASLDRKSIMTNNPLLPYGIIVTEKERQVIEELIEDIDLSQLVPIFSHSNKEASIEFGSNQILTNPSLLKYDQEALNIHIEKIANQKEELAIEKKAAEETAENYLRSIKDIENFKWTKEYEKELYYKREELADKIKIIIENQDQCQMKIDQLIQDVQELKERSHEIDKDIEKNKGDNKRFNEYIERDHQYIQDLDAFNQAGVQIKVLDKELDKLSQDWDSLEALNEEIKVKQSLKIVTLNDAKKEFDLVKNSKEDELIKVTKSELEGKLKACKAKTTDEIDTINRRLSNVKKDIERSNKSIERYGLNIADVRNAEYSELIESELQSQINKLKASKKTLDDYFDKIKTDIIGLGGEKKTIINGLIGIPPLDKIKIKGNFDERKNTMFQHINKLENDITILNNHKTLLSNINVRIETKIEYVSKLQYDETVTINIDEKTEIKLKEIIDTFTEATKQTSRAINNFEKACKNIKDNYLDIVSETVKEAIKGIYILIDNLSRSYGKYYYLTERIDFYDELLGKTMNLMQIKIDQLIHSKNDLIEHAYLEAKNVYDEIPKVVDNSSIEIEGAKKKILDIQYDKIQSDDIAKEKIKDHIALCLGNITRDIKSNEDENKIRKNVIKILSTKELLNVISNIENFKVKAYKVDINEKNRKMMSWEELIVKNSDGEKFVAYFSLLVALISYSRKNTRNADMFKKKEQSKVLIMDNPFGPITSGHLLKPMFDIAKKYDTQLICLSDIKEGAVINSFNLVYNIKIRQNMMKQEYLDIEENNFAGFKTNEKLEKAYLYSRATQTSLFDD